MNQIPLAIRHGTNYLGTIMGVIVPEIGDRIRIGDDTYFVNQRTFFINCGVELAVTLINQTPQLNYPSLAA